MRAVSILVCAGLFADLPARPAAAQDYPVQSVLRAESLRFGAMMQGDTLTLRQFLADELIYTHSSGLVETKPLHLSAVGSKRTVYESIAPDSMGYRIYGNIAVGSGTVKSRGTQSGTAFDLTLRVSTVHIFRDGRWQLVLWQSTRMP